MPNPTTLFIICGLPGSGKTTHSYSILAVHQAILLSPDEWLQELGRDLWDEEARAGVESLQWSVAKQMLEAGQSVIIDWGTWTRNERENLRSEAQSLGARVELHWLDQDVDVLWDRILRRAAESPPITLEQIESWAAQFEVPDQGEVELYDGFWVGGATADNQGGGKRP